MAAVAGVENQYKVELSLDTGDGGFFELTDFTLDYLSITETGDGMPPEFTIKFRTADDTAPALLHEGANIIISESMLASALTGGQNLTSKAPFTPIDPSITRSGQDIFTIETSGVLSVPDYQHSAKVQVWGLASAMKVANNVLENYFDIHSDNIRDSDDQMNYIQPNISDMDFMRYLTRHCWIKGGEGWPSLAITAEGKDGQKTTARLFNMDEVIQKAKSGGTPWRFDNSEASFNDASRTSKGQASSVARGIPISYSNDYTIKNVSSLMNVIAGYSRKDLSYEMESQGVETQKALLAPKKLTNNANFIRNMKLSGSAGLTPRISLVGANVHPQFNVAAYTNLANRALFSSFQVNLSFDKVFYPIRPLDTAYLVIPSIKDPTEPNPSLSGCYIVGSVVREYSGKRISTAVRLLRDGPESAQGSLG